MRQIAESEEIQCEVNGELTTLNKREREHQKNRTDLHRLITDQDGSKV
jgi:hypothetical protein